MHVAGTTLSMLSVLARMGGRGVDKLRHESSLLCSRNSYHWNINRHDGPNHLGL